MNLYGSAVPDFGTDVSTFPLPDTTFSPMSGYRTLAEALCRRLLTRKGLLPFHPDYGIDVRDFINEAFTDGVRFRAQHEALNEIQQDERVDAAEAAVDFDAATGRLHFSFSVLSSAGPFRFVLAVSQLSVNLYVGA